VIGVNAGRSATGGAVTVFAAGGAGRSAGALDMFGMGSGIPAAAKIAGRPPDDAGFAAGAPTLAGVAATVIGSGSGFVGGVTGGAGVAGAAAIAGRLTEAGGGVGVATGGGADAATGLGAAVFVGGAAAGGSDRTESEKSIAGARVT
jgi:hypothetical protein